MSINDFMNKIKGQIGIDMNTAFVVLILVFVGLGSFGLGRLERGENPQNGDIKLDNENAYLVKGVIGKSELVESNLENTENNLKEKMYVASKNGKLYYKSSCSGASRIKPENQMWFSSKEEAEDSGFVLASSCN